MTHAYEPDAACGGKTDRIRSSTISRNLPLFSIADSKDRLRVVIWKLAHLIFRVTVRPREFAFSHQRQTSSAIAMTEVVRFGDDLPGRPDRPGSDRSRRA